MKLTWYVATLILKCEVAGVPSSPSEWTCIQQIHLIRAGNRDEAYEKAVALAKSQECSYLNSEGQMVAWTLVGLENLEPLSNRTVRDGTEIWGRVFHTQVPDALIVDKDHLSVFYDEKIRHLIAEEILEQGFETKLVCIRVSTDD